MGKTINLERRQCKRCRAPEGLLLSGKYHARSASSELAMAASLDMETIVRDVVEAGMLDVFRKKKKPHKSQEQVIEDVMGLAQSGAEKTEDQGYKDMQKGVAAPWKELRKRFPKK